jgi:hypothetical protein
VLVLTFNRTLRGYIADLVAQQVEGAPDVHVEVNTFAGWGQRFFSTSVHLGDAARLAALRHLCPQHPPALG